MRRLGRPNSTLCSNPRKAWKLGTRAHRAGLPCSSSRLCKGRSLPPPPPAPALSPSVLAGTPHVPVPRGSSHRVLRVVKWGGATRALEPPGATGIGVQGVGGRGVAASLPPPPARLQEGEVGRGAGRLGASLPRPASSLLVPLTSPRRTSLYSCPQPQTAAERGCP